MNKYLLKNQRKDFLTKAVLYLFAGLTIMILVIIIIFTLFKGATTTNNTYSPFSPVTQSQIPDLNQNQWLIICNRKIKTGTINLIQLRERFTGSRLPKWGEITEQNIKSVPYILATKDEVLFTALQQMATGGNPLSKRVKYEETTKNIIKSVNNNMGGISILPYSTETIDLIHHYSSVKILQIGFQSPQVSFPEENKRVSNSLSITAKELQHKIKLGEIHLIHYDLLTQDQQSSPIMVIEKRIKWNLTWSYLTGRPAHSGRWGGIFPLIINTLLLVFAAVILAFPTALFAAITITCYKERINKIILSIIKQGIDTLSGIPSIIFGLFGYVFFVRILHLGKGLAAGTFSVGLMILPTMIKTFEESLKTVPVGYEEASFALGATKLRTIFRVQVPSAIRGIITGTILAIGRVMSETAVLIFTLGTGWGMNSLLNHSANGRVLSQNLYLLFSEANYSKAFSSAAVLMIMILVINLIANQLLKYFSRMHIN